MRLFSWDAVTEDRPSEAVTRKAFHSDTMTLVRRRLKPHSEIREDNRASEQVSMITAGSVTVVFPDGAERVLEAGHVMVLQAGVPHALRVGGEGCDITDIYAPVREDVQASVIDQEYAARGTHEDSDPNHGAYAQLQARLADVDIKIGLKEIMDVPLDLLTRYAYDKQAVSMGQIRDILGLTKQEAKQLIRKWKHGDDHSEYSLQRKKERLVIVPTPLAGQAETGSES